MKKLSAAQTELLSQIFNAGPTGIPSHTKYRKGEYRVNLHTARAASEHGLISWLNVGEPTVVNGREFYAQRLIITPEGCKAIGKTWNDMVKGHSEPTAKEEKKPTEEKKGLEWQEVGVLTRLMNAGQQEWAKYLHNDTQGGFENKALRDVLNYVENFIIKPRDAEIEDLKSRLALLEVTA